jgi:uncharacterized Zn finger protein (UPF0148 family)
MKLCDACGSPKAMIGMGGAILCRTCEPDIRIEMDQLRAAGKPVNVLHIARRIYRETHSGGDYLLRDIPEELMLRAKHRALDEGGSLRDLILSALHAYLK